MRIARTLVLIALTLWSFGVCAQGRGVRLGDLSWPDAEVRLAESPLVIIPFGAGAKEHGVHLPMNADQVVMDDLLDRAPQDFKGYEPGLLARDPNDPAYSGSGIYGDATLATAEKGKWALEVMTREWLTTLDGFARVPLRRSE